MEAEELAMWFNLITPTSLSPKSCTFTKAGAAANSPSLDMASGGWIGQR